MAVIKENIRLLNQFFDKAEVREITRMAVAVENEETIWRNKLKDLMKQINEKIVEQLEKKGRVSVKDVDQFDEFFLLQMLGVHGMTLRTVKKLGKLPKGQTPRNLQDLMKLWDKYRKKGELPPRVKEISEKVKKAYIKKCQSVWDRKSEAFREGEVATRKAAVEAVEAAGKTTYSRAKMIVETETTYYYNKTRRDLYDKSADVTHYLYMAIRDHRTTKWCKTRHGLVYRKDDPLFDKETPPIHWNCRSEILPLSPLNPRHKELIDDPKKLRRNHKCEPLPEGWNRY